MKFELFKESPGILNAVRGLESIRPNQWRWRLIANNGKQIASSGEGYNNKQDCLDAIELVKSTDKNTPVNEV